MLEVVTMKEIDAIFAVTDGLGIHRETLVIPLGPAHRGACAACRAASSRSRSTWTGPSTNGSRSSRPHRRRAGSVGGDAPRSSASWASARSRRSSSST